MQNRCHAKTREARKNTCKREKREKKVKPHHFQKTPSFFCSSLKRVIIFLEASLLLVHIITYLKRVFIPLSTTTTTIIPLLPERRFRRCPTRIKTILIILIKTRSIAFARLRMPFRTTNGSRLAIYTPSFRSFPVALMGYDERCLFALQRWTRWWKQRQRQQQKRRR